MAGAPCCQRLLLQRSMFNDWDWWADYGDEVNERFGAWLAY